MSSIFYSTCSCYFVTCVLKIEKQRRIERIKQKRAQLQELLLQVKKPGCVHYLLCVCLLLPDLLSPCFLLWGPSDTWWGCTSASSPRPEPVTRHRICLKVVHLRGIWGRMDTCICMAESLFCPPETITTLLISCISI